MAEQDQAKNTFFFQWIMIYDDVGVNLLIYCSESFNNTCFWRKSEQT